MLKLLGALMLILSSTAAGLAAARKKHRQEKCLSDLISALDYMRREITLRSAPMPELFLHLGECAEENVGEMFRYLAQEVSGDEFRPLSELWEYVVRNYLQELPSASATEAAELGDLLGKYDQQEQARSIDAAVCALRCQLEETRREAAVSARTGGAVGAAAGVMIVLCLI